jgi:hypothetical protein
MSKEGKHHYIPIFYLKQWAGESGRLCEYSRPYDTVKPRLVHPDGTGFVHGLYRVSGLPFEESQYVEQRFMQYVDNKAAIALKALIDPTVRDEDLTWDMKIHWAMFIYGLVLRSPTHMAKVQKSIAAKKPMIVDRVRIDRDGKSLPDQPAVPLRAPYAAPEMLPNMFASRPLIQGINKMEWITVHVNEGKHSILTSDRPIIMSNDLARPNDFLLIPLSPSILFIAANSKKMVKRLKDMDINKLVVSVNDRVSKQAIDYVYGVDNRHLLFVSRRLGKRWKSTPLG